jgi:hypothetical protein
MVTRNRSSACRLPVLLVLYLSSLHLPHDLLDAGQFLFRIDSYHASDVEELGQVHAVMLVNCPIFISEQARSEPR